MEKKGKIVDYRLGSIFDNIDEKLFGKVTVLELSRKTITDYERGVIYGRIDMYNELRSELLGESNG